MIYALRNAVLTSIVLLSFCAVVESAEPQRSEIARPNILIILMDDLRADALRCAGHPIAQTPNIDRLATEGAMFQNAFVTTPICLPSRASFLTGQYTHTHRVQFRGTAENQAISVSMVTFPALLQKAGYDSGYFGKWHIGSDDSPRPGFDRWVSFREQGEYVDPLLNIDGERIQATGYLTDILAEHVVDYFSQPREKPFIA